MSWLQQTTFETHPLQNNRNISNTTSMCLIVVNLLSLLRPPTPSISPPFPLFLPSLPGHVKTCFTSGLTKHQLKQGPLSQGWHLNNSIGINLMRGGEKPQRLSRHFLRQEGRGDIRGVGGKLRGERMSAHDVTPCVTVNDSASLRTSEI